MPTHKMAGTLTDLQKSDKYQRTLSLNFDCGSDTLRKLINTILDDKGTSLKNHMKDANVQDKIKQLKKQNKLYPDQIRLLNSNDPDLECMDVTLLTTILLELFPITSSQKTNIKALKKKRNELAHKARSMLEDDIPYIEASVLILALSKDISNEFEKEIDKRIQELKKRELVRTKSNMEVIVLNNESLMVKLVESEKNEQVDGDNETWIKLGLTKYVRQLAQSLDVDVFLLELKRQGVINDTIKRTIEQTYNYEEQMQLLVLHMMDETRENLLKFCACLREMNSLLTDLVQHKPSDKREIGRSLKLEEKKKITQIIQDAFTEEEKRSVACEDVHIFVEDKRKCTTTFQAVLESVKECFPHVSFEDNDSCFHGIKPKDDIAVFSEDTVLAEDSEEVLTDMPCDKFGAYLAKKMEETREGIGCHFEETALEECISAKIFGRLTDEQLEELFSPGLKSANIKFGFGIKAALSDLQKNIKRQLDRTCSGQNDTLRKFDTPAENTTYNKSTVRPAAGNLLTPAHEFIYPDVKKQRNTAFMAKEVMRFASACINGKKNGTIHFGIKEACNGTGEVIGMPKERISDVSKLNDEIHSCILNCFEVKHQLIAERCIRPAQIITVEEDMVVLEVDIVPFSSYVREEFIQINFPPKGNQRQKCFAYKENIVVTIDQTKLAAVENDFKRLFEERYYLEKDTQIPCGAASSKTVQKLRKLLTGGNKFVTDAFTPVICSGNITGSPDEVCIREHVSDMSIAFTSSAGVFDFDSSVDLRCLVEKDNNYFQVKIPEDFSSKRLRRESDITGDFKIWLYSNGNEELGKDKMSTEMWYSKRLEGVQNALNQTRQQIPEKRGLLIFLVFQKPMDKDPMLEIARETFLKTFKDECIVIAESDELLQDWRKEIYGRLTKEDFDSKIVTGLPWDEITSIVKSVFRPSKDVLYKFPDSKGQVVEMTSRELDELQLQSLELVNGFSEEQCRIQEEENDEKCRIRRSEHQEVFYKGNEVSWWNFYYSHVGKRDIYDSHKEEMRDKLQSVDGTYRYETHQIEHNPGAGGSTLARHILWYFSQIRQTPKRAYRCCIVQRLTDDTADEIYRFKTFKDKSDTKPVIVLVDNKSEEHLNSLKARIDETAYKKGSPGKLFCLLLIVTRVPVSHRSRERVLVHNLTREENIWFEKKFEELESSRDINVKTLIAFNVMRHSFDVKFIEETTQQLINDISYQEKKLLEILSIICTFDSDSPVPETVFDSLMLGTAHDPNRLQLGQCLNRPFGIVWSEKERRSMQQINRETWNVNLTGAMELLITHRRSNSNIHFHNGVCILSQPLSKAIMNHIMETENKSFEDMVDDLLLLLRQHCSEKNPMSKQFTRIVCSLFTYRETYTEKGDAKIAKFSALVLQLERQSGSESIEQAQNRVIRMMKKCFDISGNAMVGQQFARYHYQIKDYDSAEEVIQRCLSILPLNTYLLDTYGQIFKSKMEHIIGSKSGLKMNDIEAKEFIELAFKAVEKFKQAQKASISNEDNTSFNSNCFNMEVVTALYLLENFHKFECFVNKETFWCFLNETDFMINGSPYDNILKIAPMLEQFRKGSETQCHIEVSLRTLEEKSYMTRNHLTSVITPSKDLLLLKPRERFELFYGSKEHTLQFEFLSGVGLKLLMKSYQGEKSHPKLRERAAKAEQRLECEDKTELERDLLVHLGYSIIEISNQYVQIDLIRYRKLLNYSAHLWQIQRKKRIKERHYVEAYLYYALLHWILPCRADAGLENLSHPETYKTLLKEWEAVYLENNYIKSKDKLFKEKPKTYFALGYGKAGNDVVDLEWLRHEWREAKLKEGRLRREVKADNHWHHPVFEDRLMRLSGTVDSSGRWITTEVKFKKCSFPFQIHTNESNFHLSNRAVTFVLGFSWMAPVALDVRRADKIFKRQMSQSSPENLEENELYSGRDQSASIGGNASFRHKEGNGYSKGSETMHAFESELEVANRLEGSSLFDNNEVEPSGLPQRPDKTSKRTGYLENEPVQKNEMATGRGWGRGNGARPKSQSTPHERSDIKKNVTQSPVPVMHPEETSAATSYQLVTQGIDTKAGPKNQKWPPPRTDKTSKRTGYLENEPVQKNEMATGRGWGRGNGARPKSQSTPHERSDIKKNVTQSPVPVMHPEETSAATSYQLVTQGIDIKAGPKNQKWPPPRSDKTSKRTGYLENEPAQKNEMATGRERGWGRGNGTPPMSQSTPHERSDIKKNVTPSPVPVMHLEETSAATSYQLMTPGINTKAGPKNQKSPDQFLQPSSTVANEGYKCEEAKGVWCEVRNKKKTQSFMKEQRAAPPTVSVHAQQMPSKLTPKQNFEILISRCQEIYPNSSRENIIHAYEKVKQKHNGNVKLLGAEKLVREIGKKLYM